MNPASPENANAVAGSTQWLQLPSNWPAQADLLQWCQTMSPGAATILIIGGLVYLLFGWYIFKALVTINAALIGGYAGSLLGQRAGGTNNIIAGAGVGAVIAAAIAWPLMKYAVALMGGVVGALLGASLWRAAGLPPGLSWAGAACGLIGFGMLSFILFRGSVMMYTSLQGSVMLIFGLLGLIYKYQSIAPKITENMSLKPFLLPMCIFIPALLGMIYQQTQYAEPEPAANKKK